MSPLEIETGGIAIDFLHELVHVHERFRENGEEKRKGERPDVFIAAHWSRSSRPGVNHFL